MCVWLNQNRIFSHPKGAYRAAIAAYRVLKGHIEPPKGVYRQKSRSICPCGTRYMPSAFDMSLRDSICASREVGAENSPSLPPSYKPLRILQKLPYRPRIKRHDQGKHPRRAAVHEEYGIHVPLGQSHHRRQHQSFRSLSRCLNDHDHFGITSPFKNTKQPQIRPMCRF